MQRDVLSHPVTPGRPIPTPPSKYSLPFNRNENAVITLGPDEPDTHTGKSSEAIDFSPKTYGWTQILAVKPGHVFINDFYDKWGNLVVIKSDVGNHADAFYAYVEQVVGYSWTWSTNPGDVPVANPTPMGDKFRILFDTPR